MLCEEGKLSLDDPIVLHLPELKDREIWVSDDKTEKARHSTTVRDLLRHASGYPSGWGGDAVNRIYRQNWKSGEDVTLPGMAAKIAPAPLLYGPGTRWVYGLSSDLLAAVVAKAAEMPFEKFLQTRLLGPLGMTDTGYVVPAEKAGRLSVNYRVRDGEPEVATPAEGSSYLKDPVFKGGGSGLVSTITDYARFLLMIASGGEFQGKRYLRKDTVDLMRTNQLPRNIPCISFGEEQRHGTGFGLGLAVRFATDDRWDPDAVVGVYAWGGAASTHYWLSPENGLIVVTMEQTMPYTWNLEMKLKPIIYKAVENNPKSEFFAVSSRRTHCYEINSHARGWPSGVALVFLLLRLQHLRLFQ